MRKSILHILIMIFAFSSVKGQKEDLSCVWPAQWIMTEGPAKEFSVHHFRKQFVLKEVPDSLIIHTSGDNRYQLFVNEKMLTWGPLRGDLRNWYYESTDIAPLLRKGKNVIAVVVLNYGSHPPDAQLSVQTGFLLAADREEHRFLNTPAGWKGKHNTAYSPNIVGSDQVRGYYGGGSKEIVDGNQYVWDWEKIDFDDSKWADAILVERAFAKTCKWASRWKLTPRELPFEALIKERFESVRIAENVLIPEGFPIYAVPVNIPANTQVSMVLDRGHYTTAYPVFNISGGKHTQIKFTYSEAPFIDIAKKDKGNRSTVEGKQFFGFYDLFISNGEPNREYKPLWWRAYRYINIEIETKEEALLINDVYGIYSSYPFEQKAKIQVDDQDKLKNGFIQKMIEIGDRTIRACAHEHFMDCPYFEESQFQGDSRIQMLVSYYNYGDPSLAKQGIELFSWSLNNEGFLSARYPTNSYYYIPNYSIYWIGMLYDYMMLYDDHAYIADKLHIVRYLIHYFERNENDDGRLKSLDYHQFVDWSYRQGEPPIDENGHSSVVDLHYLLALQWAAALEEALGNESWYLEKYRAKIENLKKVIQDKYWYENLELFTDLPGNSEMLSQHANCLAIITGVISGDDAKTLMRKVLEKENMVPATLYWSFYVFEALHKAGLGNEYLNHLGIWEEVMDLGISTWPETGIYSRSECHGWGASPNYHLLKIIAGINPISPGFREVLIEPNPGDLEKIEATFPHWKGLIYVEMDNRPEHRKASVTLPKGLSGIFRFHGFETKLSEGYNEIKINE
ncbi:MAG: hypothetical protein JJU28_12025 [Cyclobacteriaceae bacterium]|nr:hypothetical protein [Cyclobacteriaceae bacterium]